MKTKRDQYDEQAEKLLPCVCDGAYFDGNVWKEWHPKICPASRRPAVAAALREQGQRNAEAEAEIERLRAQLAQAQAEVERLAEAEKQLADRERRLEEALALLNWR